jgi:hypothetical protein
MKEQITKKERLKNCLLKIKRKFKRRQDLNLVLLKTYLVIILNRLSLRNKEANGKRDSLTF